MNNLKQTFRFLAVLLLFLFCIFPVVAKPQIPNQTGWVMDTASVLTASENAQLEQYLRNLDSNTGVQIAVFIVDSLEGYAIEDYSYETLTQWQQKDKADKAALLLIAINDRKLRIETSYNLEGTLTDIKSGLIIRNVIAPYFQEGDYATGIIAGVQTIANISAGEAAGTIDSTIAYTVSTKDTSKPSYLFSAFLLILFLIIMMAGFNRKNSQTPRKDFVTNDVVHAGIGYLILSGLFGSHGSHGGGSGFSGGSSFGGFSGGGMGGGFGGGGASGSW